MIERIDNKANLRGEKADYLNGYVLLNVTVMHHIFTYF